MTEVAAVVGNNELAYVCLSLFRWAWFRRGGCCGILFFFRLFIVVYGLVNKRANTHVQVVVNRTGTRDTDSMVLTLWLLMLTVVWGRGGRLQVVRAAQCVLCSFDDVLVSWCARGISKQTEIVRYFEQAARVQML